MRQMSYLAKAILMLGVAIVGGLQYALASQTMLNTFFSQTKTLQARFTQEVVDETGFVLDRSSGSLYLSRPGKFRWDYDAYELGDESSEERGQQIIADGEAVYILDTELQQATKRDLSNALAEVPSLSLVTEQRQVEEYFKIIDVGLTDGLSWVILTPKSEDAGFQSLLLGFDQDVLNAIEMVDALNNKTRLTLTSIVLNPTIDNAKFEAKFADEIDLIE